MRKGECRPVSDDLCPSMTLSCIIILLGHTYSTQEASRVCAVLTLANNFL